MSPVPSPSYSLKEMTGALNEKYEQVEVEGHLNRAAAMAQHSFSVISHDLAAVQTETKLEGGPRDLIVLLRRKLSAFAKDPEGPKTTMALLEALSEYSNREKSLKGSALASRGFKMIEQYLSLNFNYSYLNDLSGLSSDPNPTLKKLLQAFQEDIEFFNKMNTQQLEQVCNKVAEVNDPRIFNFMPSYLRLAGLPVPADQGKAIKIFLEFNVVRKGLLEDAKLNALMALADGKETYDFLFAFNRINQLLEICRENKEFRQGVQTVVDEMSTVPDQSLTDVLNKSTPEDLITLARKLAAIVRSTALDSLVLREH